MDALLFIRWTPHLVGHRGTLGERDRVGSPHPLNSCLPLGSAVVPDTSQRCQRHSQNSPALRAGCLNVWPVSLIPLSALTCATQFFSLVLGLVIFMIKVDILQCKDIKKNYRKMTEDCIQYKSLVSCNCEKFSSALL